MKKCPYCGKEYSDDENTCAVDEYPLVLVPPEQSAEPKESGFFLCRGDHQSGPHALDELKTMAKEKRIGYSDLLWREGWDGWRHVVEVPGVLTPRLSTKSESAPVTSQREVKDLDSVTVKQLEPNTPGALPSSSEQSDNQCGPADLKNKESKTPNILSEQYPAKQSSGVLETDSIGVHLFLPRGRIGRVRWLVRGLIFSVLSGIPLLGLICWYLFIVSAIKRLHDFNFRGWWLFLFVPVALFLFIALSGGEPVAPNQFTVETFGSVTFLLALIPGMRGENRFGPVPRQRNEKGKRVYE